ncbi:HD domain-containing protein [bacterium]|nr:HD domain-containing protein [bacterium]
MPADRDRWLDLLLRSNDLKTTPRTGWHLRGVPAPEGVAAHSWGTAMVALTLAEMSDEPLDRGRVLAMAVLHDLAEAEVSDIPRLASRFLPDGAKNTAEARALDEMLDGLPVQASWTALMDDYKTEASAEARLVRDADRLEFLLQAWVYRETTGNRRLAEVRTAYRDRTFATRAAQDLAEAILARWQTLDG